MKKFFFASALIGLTIHANAQLSTIFEINYPDSKSVFGIEADYRINSNAITSAFTNAYVFGNFIDKDLKDGSLDKMKDANRLGSAFNGGLYYRHRTENFLGLKNSSYFFSLKERTFFNTDFPKDLFHLYFYGNKPLAGQTADISDFNYRSIQYEQLQFGIMKEVQKENLSFGYSIALSVLNGQRFLEIKTSRGSLYTQQDAEFIDLNLQLEARESDSTNSSFGATNGIGTSADLEFHFSVEDNFTIRFSAKDIGFIAWNNKSTSFQVDTNYHFEGVVVNNLLDSIYLDLKSEDDFKNGFIENKKSESFSTSLPIYFNLNFEKTLVPDKWIVTLGTDYFLNSDYLPLVYLKGNYYFNNKTHAGISFQYGGYGGFHTGLYFDKDLGKGYIVSLGSAYIDGYIIPSSSTGQGAYATIKKVF